MLIAFLDGEMESTVNITYCISATRKHFLAITQNVLFFLETSIELVLLFVSLNFPIKYRESHELITCVWSTNVKHNGLFGYLVI